MYLNNTTTSGMPTSGELLSQLQAAQHHFARLRREELRSWSEAIERVGPCPACGRRITLRTASGDVLVMCTRVYAQLVRQIPRAEACGCGGCDRLATIRLETFPCERRAPLQ